MSIDEGPRPVVIPDVLSPSSSLKMWQ
jgi:hypothetical protein